MNRILRFALALTQAVVEAVPWARPRSRFTRPFEDWVAWMAVHCTM